MNVDGYRAALHDIARRLRPAARSPFIPLIKLAHECGLRVEIRFYSSDKERLAQIDLSSSPSRIIIYRKSRGNGFTELTADLEHVLTPRERFSIAHEMGHFFALKELGASPVSKEIEPGEYRKQENCMDEFAQTLLVPDWLAKRWLASIAEEPISLQCLKSWAIDQCAVSPEVVARSLTRFEDRIGFIKAAEAVRITNEKRLLVVFYSSYGAGMQLPNLHSYIENDTFTTAIKGDSGLHRFKACAIGRSRLENMNVAWQQSKVNIARSRREFKSAVRLSGTGYWISFRSQCQNRSGADLDAQLPLFRDLTATRPQDHRSFRGGAGEAHWPYPGSRPKP